MGAWSVCGAVDAEGEVLDVLVQSKCNKRAALKLMRKLLRKYAIVPERLVTDDLRGDARDKWLVRASIAWRCGSPRRSRTEAARNSDQNCARRIARRR
jgi:transposase-like protein